MYTISKRIHFCAAHRIEGHPKCGRLHGHNYEVEVVVGCKADDLDPETGFVMDFGDLKGILRDVEDFFDHKYIVSEANVQADDVVYQALVSAKLFDDFVIISANQSTAESLARFIWGWMQSLVIPDKHFVTEVTIWETPNNEATFRPVMV